MAGGDFARCGVAATGWKPVVGLENGGKFAPLKGKRA